MPVKRSKNLRKLVPIINFCHSKECPIINFWQLYSRNFNLSNMGMVLCAQQCLAFNLRGSLMWTLWAKKFFVFWYYRMFLLCNGDDYWSIKVKRILGWWNSLFFKVFTQCAIDVRKRIDVRKNLNLKSGIQILNLKINSVLLLILKSTEMRSCSSD